MSLSEGPWGHGSPQPSHGDWGMAQLALRWWKCFLHPGGGLRPGWHGAQSSGSRGASGQSGQQGEPGKGPGALAAGTCRGGLGIRWQDPGCSLEPWPGTAVGYLVRVPKPRGSGCSLAPKHRGMMGADRGCLGLCACFPVPPGPWLPSTLPSKIPPLPATCRVLPGPVASLPPSLGWGTRPRCFSPGDKLSRSGTLG